MKVIKLSEVDDDEVARHVNAATVKLQKFFTENIRLTTDAKTSVNSSVGSLDSPDAARVDDTSDVVVPAIRNEIAGG